MALEAVVYPHHHQDTFSNGFRDFYSSPGGAWGHEHFNTVPDDTALLALLDNDRDNKLEQPGLPAWCWDTSSSSLMQQAKDCRDPNSPPHHDHSCTVDHLQTLAGKKHHSAVESSVTVTGRRKRRRTRNTKNKEEIENQRMTHIAVERNRRKQMNEYLAELRSLMPPTYVQRGDQASIVGGAINFVKELEQLLQTMEVHKKTKKYPEVKGTPSPFADFFSFPQYSTRATQPPSTAEEPIADQDLWAVADIEVTMVETHANLKILSKKRPRQLLKLVAGLQSLRLSILHLNVTTLDQTVLYSVSVKIDDGCHLSTVDEIAAAVNQMLHKIEEETAFS